MNKYENLIMYSFGIGFLIVFWIIRFIKVHNPKDFCKENFYFKSLSFRFYLSFFIILGFLYAIVRDFIKLFNQ